MTPVKIHSADGEVLGTIALDTPVWNAIRADFDVFHFARVENLRVKDESSQLAVLDKFCLEGLRLVITPA